MRVFARPFPLQQLSLEARVLYAGFCVFMLFGVWTSAWLAHDDGFGTDPATVVRYYRGDAAAAASTPTSTPTAPSTTTDGPALALPDDVVALDAAALREEKSARQVMETFHFHAFTMPVCLLIVGHIFMMCALSTRKKVVVLVLASGSTLLHLLLPVVVRFGGDGVAAVGAWLFVPSAVLLLLTWTLMLAMPLVELARAPAARQTEA